MISKSILGYTSKGVWILKPSIFLSKTQASQRSAPQARRAYDLAQEEAAPASNQSLQKENTMEEDRLHYLYR